MTVTMCMVQQGQISPEAEAALKADMTSFAADNFGAPAEIKWTAIEEGSGYTEAKPSTSIIVSMTADRALERGEREGLLRDLSDIWIRHARKTPHEIVAVIRDPEA